MSGRYGCATMRAATIRSGGVEFEAVVQRSAELIPGASAAKSSHLGLALRQGRPASLPAGHKPLLLVVIDTEEEFDWSEPLDRSNRSVSSIAGLVPLQRMFHEIGVRPTYVIDHPVASNAASSDLLASFSDQGLAEIGAHLHPWVTPPHVEPVTAFNSYGGNLDKELERAKLGCLVEAIVRGTGVRPVSFKAGRYGIAPRTPTLLNEQGFRIDLSTSPGFNWSGDGGPDFTHYPNDPWWIPGSPDILEIPTTGGYYGPLAHAGLACTPVDNVSPRRQSNLGVALGKLRLARRAMLSPEGFDLHALKTLTETLLARGISVLTLSFHSPSVHVGHTPFVRTPAELDAFFETIRAFAVWFERTYSGRFVTANEALGLFRPSTAD